MKAFETVWADLQANLAVGTVIRNWTVLHRYMGQDMVVNDVQENYIKIDPPNAQTIQRVPKEDFEKVWRVWPDYKSGTFKRGQFQDVTRYSKYIISILHWYESR
jgi:hypothetical protein